MTGRSVGFDPRRRIAAMAIALTLLAAVLTAQLLRVQVLNSERYVAWGNEQRLVTTPLPGERGALLDRNGEELAVTLPTDVIFSDPAAVSDPVAEGAELAGVLGRPASEIQALLAAENRFVYLDRRPEPGVADRVRALDLDGVFIGEEPERFHPNGDSLGAGLLGSVGVDNVGLSGLEKQYDEFLAGTPGELIAERSIDGRSIPDGQREISPAVHGANVQLTIDKALQFEVERTLAEQIESTGGKGGVVVITEPATGEILAIASMIKADDGSIVSTPDNRAVTWSYEPASVMKALTFSAVLNEGEANPDTKLMIEDQIQLYEETFVDSHTYEPTRMTVTDILVRSSNTGTITWAAQLGATRLDSYLRDFGLGQSTGLGFPGESGGLLDPVEDWSGTSFATIAIGQGIAVTPLQMVTAYSVIANDGVYIAPKIVRSVSRPGDDTQLADPSDAGANPPATRRVIDSAIADDVTDMLTQVTARGTTTAAQVPGYDIAAKTGTARKVQESGGYVDGEGRFHYTATVAGFFPAEDPKFSMIVIIDEPTAGGSFASENAAPLFGDLAAWTLRHFQVSPAADLVFEAAAGRDARGGSFD